MVDQPKDKSRSSDSAAEASSSRTQRMPHMLVEPSSGFDISVFGEADSADATQPTLARPQVIVMEERAVGVSDALAKLGFLVRPAQTGVEAMSMCADNVPLAVVVGPGDAERRRVLTGALRLRFSGVAIVYVLPTADVAARASATAEGVDAVLSWPLPTTAEVMAAIPHRAEPSPLSAPIPAITRVVPPTAAILARSSSDVPELSADQSETGSVPAHLRPVLRPLPPLPTSSPPPEATLLMARPTPMPLPPRAPMIDDLETLQVSRLDLPMTRDGYEDRTAPGLKPAADVQDALAPRGEIGDVLRAVAPFLWGLDDCARFLDSLAPQHGKDAEVHARTVRLVARLLAQLQARVGEIDP